ncbi:hypothetical protein HDV05_002261 [Chytridiales sp. JEL 0842]|nr:hypothetical protein HDV05_002261 [Chytridiales sp. JEL 0842]
MTGSANEKQTMKALIAHGPKDYSLTSTHPISLTNLPENHIVIEVAAAGICASDSKMYQGGEFYWGPGGRAKRGVVPGHEFAGYVYAAGPNGFNHFNVKEGDLVVIEQFLACQTCWHCEDGGENKCDQLAIFGQKVDGAMAEYMIIPPHAYVHLAPRTMNPYLAVLAEPLAVSVHAVMDRCPKLKEDDTVVVSGSGMIGLGILATLKYVYPKTKVIMLDNFSFKLHMSTREGADVAICVKNKSEQEILELILPHCGARRGGCDVFFECTGNPVSIATGLHLLRKRGNMVHVGLCKETTVTANWNHISAGKELTIYGSSLGHNAWTLALKMLEKGGVLKNVVTHIFSLEDFEEALKLAFGTEECVKVVVDPRNGVKSRVVWDCVSAKGPEEVPAVTWASEEAGTGAVGK